MIVTRRRSFRLGGRLAVLVVRLLGWVLAQCPDWGLDLVARGVAALWYHAVPVRRDVALDNLRRALGEGARGEPGVTARKVGYHLARNYLEFLTLPFLSRASLRERFVWEGRHHLERALDQKKGVLVVSGHLGAFDLLAAAVAAEGLPINIISRTPRSRLATAIWMGYRESSGVRIFPERRSVFRVLRALSNGEIVAFMLDQDVHADRGVFVDFFGRPACTSDSVAVLALRTGAPVIPVFTRRVQGRHLVRCLPPIEKPSRGDRRDRVLSMTRACTRVIEREIRQVPEQWLWLHRRWKTRPVDRNE